MERHIGTAQVFKLVALPPGWKCRDGLGYPLTLVKASGAKLTFWTYEEHHEYIRQLFRP